MAQVIKHIRSAVPGKVPTTAELDLGVLAINTYDGKAFLKKDNGTESVVELGGSSGGSSAMAENDQLISADYTLASGRNASSVGPVAVAAGVTVTISANSTWMIF